MRKILFPCGIVIALGACANINTVDRTTQFSATREKGGELTPDGSVRAVHLDIQQRLVLSNSLGEFCAEPSPDALAAYAAAIGLGAGAPAQGAASLAVSGGSNAASVGLRTQSITLMRDALYRVCEAWANNAINEAQAMTLLARSQDLTAVILAVEQLTGATAANQVALTTTTEAAASANIANASKLLQAQMDDLDRRRKRLVAVASKRDAAIRKRDATEIELKEAEQATKTGSDAEKAAARAKVELLKARLEQEKGAVAAAESSVGLAQKSVENGEKTVDALEQQADAAISSANTATDGSATFSKPVQTGARNNVDWKAISNSVQAMVQEVFKKRYITDYCIGILRETEAPDHAVSTCSGLLVEQARAETASLIGSVDSNFSPDDTTRECIRAWIGQDNAKNTAKLVAWLRDNPVKGLDSGKLLRDAGMRVFRESFIRSENIPC